jgi:hypothetical protein
MFNHRKGNGDIEMKKILLCALLLISLNVIGQISPVMPCRVATLTTAFGQNIPQGTEVYCISDSTKWTAITNVASASTLTTAASSFYPTVIRVTGTLPVVVTGSAGKMLISTNMATTSLPGLLSAADKLKINGITTVNNGILSMNVSATGLTGSQSFTANQATNATFSISLTSGYTIPSNASIANWNTAYTDRMKWDGGATGLVASTGRTSLGLGTIATYAAGDYSVSSHTHATYVPYTGASSNVTLGNYTITAGNFILNSDLRLKKNIKGLSNSDLWTAEKIDFHKYSFIGDSTNATRYGVIAQEIEKYFPELITKDKNGIKSVSYIDLLILIVAQQKNAIFELENRVKKLEDENKSSHIYFF